VGAGRILDSAHEALVDSAPLQPPAAHADGTVMESHPFHMKSMLKRILAVAVLAILAWVLLAAATPAAKTAAKPAAAKSATATREPDKLVILSTVDVKGKTSPCG
jgi:hypothetical protein